MRWSSGSLISMRAMSAGVPGHIGADVLGKEFEDLAGLSVSTGLTFAVDHFAVDGDVKYALAAGNQLQALDGVLVVVEKIIRHAHGVLGIVSRYAVCDFNLVAHCVVNTSAGGIGVAQADRF